MVARRSQALVHEACERGHRERRVRRQYGRIRRSKAYPRLRSSRSRTTIVVSVVAGWATVVVSGSPAGNDEIFVMNADGSDQRNLTRTPGINEDSPSWSPTGAGIVFASGSKFRRARTIHTIRPDGRRHRNLGQGTQPNWRADGRSIVFIRASGAQSDIYVMTASGRNPTSLTNSGVGTRNVSPAWSPR